VYGSITITKCASGVNTLHCIIHLIVSVNIMSPKCTIHDTPALVKRATCQFFATIGAVSEKTYKSAHVPIGMILMYSEEKTNFAYNYKLFTPNVTENLSRA